MSLIPKQYLNCVVAIGVDSMDARYPGIVWIATGFLVAKRDNSYDQQSTVYLITNKHVFGHQTSVYIRFNSVYGAAAKDYVVVLRDKIGTKMYTEHPNERVDVVAMQINPDALISEGAIWDAFDLQSNSLDLDSMMRTGVDEGCLVYAFGFRCD